MLIQGGSAASAIEYSATQVNGVYKTPLRKNSGLAVDFQICSLPSSFAVWQIIPFQLQSTMVQIFTASFIVDFPTAILLFYAVFCSYVALKELTIIKSFK